MSAYGFLVAVPEVNEVRSHPGALHSTEWGRVRGLFDEMEEAARDVLDFAADDGLAFSPSVDMRYVGQGYEVEVRLPDVELSAASESAISEAFAEEYRRQFGRTMPEHEVEVVSWRLTARARTTSSAPTVTLSSGEPRLGEREVDFPGHGVLVTPVFDRHALPSGTVIEGPVVIQERESSCSFGPECRVTVTGQHHLVVDFADTDERLVHG